MGTQPQKTTSPLRLLLIGSSGRMGQALKTAIAQSGNILVAACDLGDDWRPSLSGVDVAIDFSFHTATAELVEACSGVGIPVVIGTTGHTAEEKKIIHAQTEKIPIVWSGNYAVGVNILFWATRQLAHLLGEEFEPEILEYHHHDKKDAPSGTAERLLEVILEARGWTSEEVVHGRQGLTGARPARQVGMHALRGGEVVGDHTVHFAGPGERIEITHRAADRRIFALGALRAAHWVHGREAGLYRMENVLGLETP
jgi:4-hydroxy-tetrahydrodipicolinate reductase